MAMLGWSPTILWDFYTTLSGECGGSVVERRSLEREVGGSNLPSPCCVLEHAILLLESNDNTQEAVALSRHD